MSRPLRLLRPFIASRCLTLNFLPLPFLILAASGDWLEETGVHGGAHLPSSPPDSSTCFYCCICLAWRRVWQPSEPAWEGHLHRRLPLFGESAGARVLADVNRVG